MSPSLKSNVRHCIAVALKFIVFFKRKQSVECNAYILSYCSPVQKLLWAFYTLFNMVIYCARLERRCGSNNIS